MSLNPQSPRAKPRWLIVGLAVLALSALTVGIASAEYPDPPVTTIPAGYFAVTDSDGPNDVPAQSDLTQMGRDDVDTDVYKIFWSWDEIDQWTGTGQTGDACALFDSDGDTFINQAICARISNTNADPTIVELVPQDADHPVFFFNCSDRKDDRCTQPDGPIAYASPTQIDAGQLGTLAKVNLITETDPFAPDGSDFPYDSTVEVHILKTLLQDNATLVNVCSYPSAGNGGNNNPFDCVVSPGGGFLSIVKDQQPDAPAQTWNFSVTKNGTTLGTKSITGDGTATPLAVLVSKSPVVVTETSIPVNWDLESVSCVIEDDGSTGSFDNTNDRVTGVAIQSGKITTCTFVNKLTVGDLTLVKRVINDNGGSADADFFGITSSAGTVTFGTGEADGDNTLKYTSNKFTVPTGSYTFAELDKAGYSEGSWSCTGATATGTAYNAGSVTVPGGGNVTCTITNNDQQGSLTLVKRVINDNGGSADADFFGITSSAGTVTFGTGEADGDNTLKYTSNKFDLDAGSYTFAELDKAGYSEGSWTCSPTAATSGTYNAGSVTVGNGVDVTCTITNNDQQGSLTLVKRVINDNGGSADADFFGITSSAGTVTFGTGEADGDNTLKYTSNKFDLDAGSYTFAELDKAGYSEGSWTCSPTAATSGTYNAGSVTVGNGVDVTCTITNNDQQGSLTLVKRVINDNGGSADADFFGITSSAGTVTFGTGEADGDNTLKYTSNKFDLDAGSYTFAELDKAGYSEGSWTCSPTAATSGTYNAGSVTVGNGVDVTCTITNNDQQGSLTLVKRVINDNGGSADADFFGITSSAGTVTFGTGEADGDNTLKYTSNKFDLDAGSYTFAELDKAGYSEGSWTCSPTAATSGTYNAGSVTVGNGVDVTCTITNNDLKAGPDGTTVQSWILHDEITITGRRFNAPEENLNVTFTLFSDDTCTTAVEVEVEGVLVPYSETVSLAGEVAKTAAGYTATQSGTYYWIASYSGDQYNLPFATDCGEEITQILAKDAYDGGRDDFVEPL